MHYGYRMLDIEPIVVERFPVGSAISIARAQLSPRSHRDSTDRKPRKEISRFGLTLRRDQGTGRGGWKRHATDSMIARDVVFT